MLDHEYNVRLNNIIDDTTVHFLKFTRKIMIETKSKSSPISSEMQVRLLEGLMAGPMKPTEISHVCCISKPNVTTLVNKLIEGGFAQRSHDENDRRVIYVTITEKGKKAVYRKRKIVKEYILKIFNKFDADEIELVLSSMDKFRGFLIKMNSIM